MRDGGSDARVRLVVRVRVQTLRRHWRTPGGLQFSDIGSSSRVLASEPIVGSACSLSRGGMTAVSVLAVCCSCGRRAPDGMARSL